MLSFDVVDWITRFSENRAPSYYISNNLIYSILHYSWSLEIEEIQIRNFILCEVLRGVSDCVVDQTTVSALSLEAVLRDGKLIPFRDCDPYWHRSDPSWRGAFRVEQIKPGLSQLHHLLSHATTTCFRDSLLRVLFSRRYSSLSALSFTSLSLSFPPLPSGVASLLRHGQFVWSVQHNHVFVRTSNLIQIRSIHPSEAHFAAYLLSTYSSPVSLSDCEHTSIF